MMVEVSTFMEILAGPSPRVIDFGTAVTNPYLLTTQHKPVYLESDFRGDSQEW